MRSINIIDWHSDFIKGLGEFTLELDPKRTLILFPHNRPARHLRAWYQASNKVAKPCLLPEMSSIDKFVASLRRELTQQPLKPAGKLDQLGLILDVIRDMHGSNQGLLSKLLLKPKIFFPWGVRLASLIEEFLRQGVSPQNLAHTSGEVAPWAEAILAQLGDISKGFVSGLNERGWTTPGLDHSYLCDNLESVTETLRQTTVVAAGFYALSGTENKLFKRLWDEGILEVLWHTEPSLTLGQPSSPDCTEHRNWLKKWNVRARLMGPAPLYPNGPEISFIEGFDLHSQLHGLQQRLTQTNVSQDAAIVLPDTGALLPVLHHLPDQDVNISMGYPLERTGLFRLMDILLSLQENKDDSGRYFWRDLLELLRHPYLKMLEPEGEAGTSPLRRVFHVHETAVRSGAKFQVPTSWKPPYTEPILDGLPATTEALRQEVLEVCLNGFSNLETLGNMAQALSKLTALLRKHGSELWTRYVIDAEYLARLSTSVIPELNGSAISQEKFGQPTLFAVLRQLCRGERVSFEPEPLTGLQIMGVLETRLLNFKNLFVLDAVEDRLPSSSPYDPLLPDPLRHAVGLPNSRERDSVSTYNFKRLLMGAQKVVLLYQAGIQPGLLDTKSVRSRYVEQLIWEREKQERRGKKLIQPGEDPIEVIHFPASPIPPGVVDIPMNDELSKLLREQLKEKGLSATRLNHWLTCPKNYFYRYLAKLYPMDEINEQGDRAAFGSIMHEVLREFLEPHLGHETDLSLLDADALVRLFQRAMDTDERMAQASWDVRHALAATAKVRLKRFLKNQGITHILALEQELSAKFEVNEFNISLTGQLDRVDKRENNIIVLDYKTGSVQTPRKGFWEDMELWERIEANDPNDTALLPELSQALHSVQLPFYLHLYREDTGNVAHDAGLIALAKDGVESLLFGPKWEEQERIDVVENMIPRLLRALVNDMLTTGSFRAQPGSQCEWCDYRGPCGM